MDEALQFHITRKQRQNRTKHEHLNKDPKQEPEAGIRNAPRTEGEEFRQRQRETKNISRLQEVGGERKPNFFIHYFFEGEVSG